MVVKLQAQSWPEVGRRNGDIRFHRARQRRTRHGGRPRPATILGAQLAELTVASVDHVAAGPMYSPWHSTFTGVGPHIGRSARQLRSTTPLPVAFRQCARPASGRALTYETPTFSVRAWPRRNPVVR